MTLALLFDLDGTMVDTDPLHIAAWNAMLAVGAGLAVRDFTDQALWARLQARMRS